MRHRIYYEYKSNGYVDIESDDVENAEEKALDMLCWNGTQFCEEDYMEASIKYTTEIDLWIKTGLFG